MALDAFIKIGDIKGGATDDKHKEWIDVLSFSWGTVLEGGAGMAGGGAMTQAGRATGQDVNLVKPIDKSTPVLFQSCSEGKHIPEVVVEFTTGGARDLKYLSIKMNDCLISSIQHGWSSGGTDHTETVGIKYSKLTLTMQPVNPKTGAPEGGKVETSWDFSAQKKG